MTISGGKLVFIGFPPFFRSQAYIQILSNLEIEFYFADDRDFIRGIADRATHCCILTTLTNETGKMASELFGGAKDGDTRKIHSRIVTFTAEEMSLAQGLPFAHAQIIDASKGGKYFFLALRKLIEELDIRGQRKFVRLKCEGLTSAKIIIRDATSMIKAEILDLSVIGMAVRLAPGAVLANQILPLSLVLDGKNITLAAQVYKETDGHAVLVFVKESLNQEVLNTIHIFMFNVRQAAMSLDNCNLESAQEIQGSEKENTANKEISSTLEKLSLTIEEITTELLDKFGL